MCGRTWGGLTLLDGHYLNLPVVEDGQLVGIVDVLKLTYATLEQVSILERDEGAHADMTD